MAFHDVTGEMVLFGGLQPTFGAYADTFTWDGEQWAQLAPASAPPARGGAQMVYDSQRAVCVLYGGTSPSAIGGPSFSDTWEWDGSTWTQRTTATAPLRSGRYGMAYDSVRGRTVVYGGVQSTMLLGASNQTWECDGTNWLLRNPGANPGPLDGPAMCYADTLVKTILFGGFTPVSGTLTNTTWAFDGTNWTTVPIVGGSPSPRYNARMVFDAARAVCVLHGGVTAAGLVLDDTWTFNGVTWTQELGTSPGPRHSFAFAFDRLRASSVLYGGRNALAGGATTTLQDTWTNGAIYAPFGSGCPGSFGEPVLRSVSGPRLGTTFTASLFQLVPSFPIALIATGFSNTNWLGQPLPLDMTSSGIPGCSLFLSPDRLDVIGASSGVGTLLLAIPNDPYFLGVTFYQQGFSFELPGFNAFGGVLSNAARAVIGN